MAEKMKAAVITGVKKIEVIDVPMPIIGPRDVLLKIKSAGLCTWEQRIYTGQTKADYPFLGGHENAGEITAIGELVTNVKVGYLKGRVWGSGSRTKDQVGSQEQSGICNSE